MQNSKQTCFTEPRSKGVNKKSAFWNLGIIVSQYKTSMGHGQHLNLKMDIDDIDMQVKKSTKRCVLSI